MITPVFRWRRLWAVSMASWRTTGRAPGLPLPGRPTVHIRYACMLGIVRCGGRGTRTLARRRDSGGVMEVTARPVPSQGPAHRLACWFSPCAHAGSPRLRVRGPGAWLAGAPGARCGATDAVRGLDAAARDRGALRWQVAPAAGAGWRAVLAALARLLPGHLRPRRIVGPGPCLPGAGACPGRDGPARAPGGVTAAGLPAQGDGRMPARDCRGLLRAARGRPRARRPGPVLWRGGGGPWVWRWGASLAVGCRVPPRGVLSCCSGWRLVAG